MNTDNDAMRALEYLQREAYCEKGHEALKTIRTALQRSAQVNDKLHTMPVMEFIGMRDNIDNMRHTIDVIRSDNKALKAQVDGLVKALQDIKLSAHMTNDTAIEVMADDALQQFNAKEG